MVQNSLRSYLTGLVEKAFLTYSPECRGAHVIESQRPDLCQFQSNNALSFAKALRCKPLDIADAVGKMLSENHGDVFSAVSTAPPGFINLTLTPSFLAEWVSTRVISDPRKGVGTIESPERIMIDFGGPNTAKPLHVGHLRSVVIGESVRRILAFAGHDVVSDVHLGDWGTPMGMLLCQIEDQFPGLPYFTDPLPDEFPLNSPVTLSDLQEMYPKAALRYKEDKDFEARVRKATRGLQEGDRGLRALWRHFANVSLEAVKEEFALLDAHFDYWLGESDASPQVKPLLDSLVTSGIAVMSEGALVIPPGPEQGEDAPPTILVKSDGAVTYAATDLATIVQRVEELKIERALYVVDARQSLHFAQVFRASEIAGLLPASKLEFIGFGTVNGKDGKPFKTRQGGLKQLRSLLEDASNAAELAMETSGVARELEEEERKQVARMVGIGAIKFADLSMQRGSNYVFDLERFTAFDGRTGPYIQYAAVRVKSLLRKAEAAGLSLARPRLTTPEETELALTLAALPETVQQAVQGRAPHHLCNYVYGLAQAFSKFWQRCPVLNAARDDAESRLGLAAATLDHLALVARLLGIEIPDRM